MAVSKDVASSWDCNYGTEIGCITFNMAVLKDKHHGMEVYQNNLDTAMRSIIGFDDDMMRTTYSLTRFECSVVKGTLLKYYNRIYRLIHCTVRVKTLLLLEPEDSRRYLEFLLNHMFTCYDGLVDKNIELLLRYPDFVFMPFGFPITSSLGLKFVLHSMKIRLSENDQTCVPFDAENDQQSKGSCREFKTPIPRDRNRLVKSTFSRKALFKVLPQKYHQFFGNEICYLCGHKVDHANKTETWKLHIHEPAASNRDPSSLQSAAKLAVMEACFKIKRSRNSPRHHPYFE